MKSIITFLIILIIQSDLLSQEITKDTVLARTIINISDSLYEEGLYDSSLNCLKLAEKTYIKYNLEKQLVNTQLTIARRLIDIGLFDSSLTVSQNCYNEHEVLFTEDKVISSWFYSLNGYANEGKGDYNTALMNYNNAYKLKLSYSEPNSIEIAQSYTDIGLLNIYLGNYKESLDLLNKSLTIKLGLWGEYKTEIADCYNNIAIADYYLGNLSLSIESFRKALNIRKKILGEIHPDIAASYMNIANLKDQIGESDSAVIFFDEALDIYYEVFSKKHYLIAACLDNLGSAYISKGDADQASKYLIEALNLRLEIFGEKHPQVIGSYNNLGYLYLHNYEPDKALDYFLKALDLQLELYGKDDPMTLSLYNNIGTVYANLNDYNTSISYHQTALEEYLKLYGYSHPDVANTYYNIGSTFYFEKKYEKALINFKKSLQIRIGLSDPNEFEIADNYNSIGTIFNILNSPDSSLHYLNNSLVIFSRILGDKNPTISMVLLNIGDVYTNKTDFKVAMDYYHKGLIANIKGHSDSSHFTVLPPIENSFSIEQRDQGVQRIAECNFNLYKNSISLEEKKKYLNQSLLFYNYCDSLFAQTLTTMPNEGDKMRYVEKINAVNEEKIMVCIEANTFFSEFKFKEKAFLYSERSKSQVLLQAISGQEAQKFAGIPDSLLEKEHNLKIDINFYEQKLAEGLDSITERNFRDKLFKANRQYEELIANFETSYPEYYSLKYSTKNPSVKNLQKLLDAKTAIRSYFVGDSTIYIFTISNKKFDVQQVAKMDNLEDTIRYFRYGLTKFSQRMTDIYQRTGVLLYQQLFPESLVLDKQIENLIIIPDGALATIPFEALLTDNLGGLNGDDFKKYPFLINRYNVNYSYSANLFYRTFPKEKQKQPELTNLNDWLALAPVFDDKTEQGVMLATRELQKQLNYLQSDTLNVRGRLLTGDYITPLPGTESETQAIIKQYENRNLKAQALLHQSANEQFIKSGGLEKYKVLHFATHGFVNSEKPELSGILLAQDSTDNQDGILYSGEIYNLKLNADLVVLSACETGLGKINKGEGIIGLTRALLYAGGKNIIVSLWQVSDESTSNLMIDFYNNLLNMNNKSFSDPLRKAKLKMISEGKFAHPFYWSPFILVGK